MKLSSAIKILFAFIVFINSIFAQVDSVKKSNSPVDTLIINHNKNVLPLDQDDKLTWHQMFTNLPSDYFHFFKNCFNEKEIPTYTVLAVLTGSMLAVDQQGWKFQNSLYNNSNFTKNISDFTVGFGNGKYQFVASAAFAAAGIILHDKTLLKTGSNITEAILSTGLLVQLLKRISGRQSPAASTENGGDWDPFPSIIQYQKDQPAFYSFPSGHLSTATAILTVIANNYPNLKWIKPVGYPLLGLLGFSLVNKGMHWYSDLPLAFFLGYSFGNIIAPVKINSNGNAESQNKNQMMIIPSFSSTGINLTAVYLF